MCATVLTYGRLIFILLFLFANLDRANFEHWSLILGSLDHLPRRSRWHEFLTYKLYGRSSKTLHSAGNSQIRYFSHYYGPIYIFNTIICIELSRTCLLGRLSRYLPETHTTRSSNDWENEMLKRWFSYILCKEALPPTGENRNVASRKRRYIHGQEAPNNIEAKYHKSNPFN